MHIAHINPISLEKQSVEEHLVNVSKLTKEFASKISLESTGELIGILHDMGKGTREFDAYIQYCFLHPNDKSLRGTIDHSTPGAKLVYENFYNTNPLRMFTAQLISLAICSHHGGLIDCIDLDGFEKYTERMGKELDESLKESSDYFYKKCMKLEQINELFNKSVVEIKEMLTKINSINEQANLRKFYTTVLEKYLFSCLIDADRYDTYLSMGGSERRKAFDRSNLWQELLDVFENKIKDFPKVTEIDFLRDEVSQTCRSFGINKTGIYQLSVPTGGGKTLSSMRYALTHAKEFNKDRILYVIPFTTIIDQTAKEIREILGRDDILLEHHSNVIIDKDEKDDDEQAYYKLLTERWDSPIILTTMVQFLETLFSGGTQSVRRLHNLANSIIIFDEIQAIPIKSINMFNSAINFLANICNVTVVLCTATQPLLTKTKAPIILSDNANIVFNIKEKFEQFKRVELVDKRIIGGYDATSVKDLVLDKMNQVDSVLVITNTKNSARKIFNELMKSNENLPEEKKFTIFHLSTGMCPSHRSIVLKDMRDRLMTQRVVCISTQLIEAGINISFGCVIRSLAGLDNIAQAAGRCNRHGERPCSEVYIINIETENVSKLLEIKEGQECTKRVLNEFQEDPNYFDKDLLSQKAMDMYYNYYFYNREATMDYTLAKPHDDKTIYDLLSGNYEADNAFAGRTGNKSKLMMKQAFKTAGNEFYAIDQNTVGVIVPYGQGKELMEKINGKCSLNELSQYLKSAQQFSVNLFKTDIKRLDDLGGVVPLKEGAIISLREEFYNNDVGITFEEQPMEFCNY